TIPAGTGPTGENERRTPCPAGSGARREVPASRWAARETDFEGRTPCPAVGVPWCPEDPPRRRRDAEDVERVAAGALGGDSGAVPPERFARFGGRTPCPAVRRTLIAAVSASMRRQRAAAVRRKATISAE